MTRVMTFAVRSCEIVGPFRDMRIGVKSSGVTRRGGGHRSLAITASMKPCATGPTIALP